MFVCQHHLTDQLTGHIYVVFSQSGDTTHLLHSTVQSSEHPSGEGPAAVGALMLGHLPESLTDQYTLICHCLAVLQCLKLKYLKHLKSRRYTLLHYSESKTLQH